MQQLSKITKLTAISLLLSAGLAFAHAGATGVVKERMDMMKDIAAQMKSLAGFVKGETQHDPASVAAAADKIAEHATHFEMIFPEGSTESPSEALPVIWTNWDDFLEKTSEMSKAAKERDAAAETVQAGSELAPLFGKLGQTCSTCHEDYRVKK